jgi:hypothetical protein
MADYIFPQSAILQKIAQDKLPDLTAQNPIFTYFPIVDYNASVLEWEQRDNVTGLQQIRGMNGQPPNVTQVGMKRFVEQPGVYGEFIVLDEKQLTDMREMGTFATPTDISTLVMAAQDQLIQRRVDRQAALAWTLAVTGTFSVTSKSGAIVHTASYLTQTFSAVVPWATIATATPLADFSSLALLARGHSVNFGAGAKAFMNRKTFNYMRSNTNAADIYGRRTQGLGTVNSLNQWNELLMMDDLPEIVVYDDGYLTDGSVVENATDFTQFGSQTQYIPDNKVVVFGQRPGNPAIGNVMQTRNINNGGAPGVYQKVLDRGEDQVPRIIEVHDGFNGGVTIFYPSAIAVMSV